MGRQIYREKHEGVSWVSAQEAWHKGNNRGMGYPAWEEPLRPSRPWWEDDEDEGDESDEDRKDNNELHEVYGQPVDLVWRADNDQEVAVYKTADGAWVGVSDGGCAIDLDEFL